MRWIVALIWRLPPRSSRWRLVLPELTGIGAMPAARASLASEVKRSAPAISPTSLAAVNGPEAGLGQQVRGDLGDQVGDLGFQRLDRLGQLAEAAQLVAGDPDARRLLGPGEPARDPRPPLAVKQRAARELQVGPEVVQMPLQRVVDRHPLREPAVRGDRPAAADRARARPGARPATSRALRATPPGRPRARRCCRTCRARAPRAATPAINVLCTRSTRSPRSIRNRSNEPETCRQSSIAHTRSSPRPRAHASSPAAPLAPDRTVCSPSSSPDVADTAAIVCERLWVSAPSTIIALVHLHSTELDARRTRLARGDATLLSSHAKASTTGDERHSERQSDPHGRQPERESARRRSRSLHRPSDITDATNPNSKPERSSRSAPGVGGGPAAAVASKR